jgi:hypothetical protein
MATNHNDEVKGFAGLERLASPTPEVTNNTLGHDEMASSSHSHESLRPAEPQPDYERKSDSSPQNEKPFAGIIDWFDAKPSRWLLLIGLAVVVIAVWPTKHKPSVQRGSVPTATEPSVPSYGSNNVFSDREIRYCLEEEIRLSAWQAAVNTRSQNAISAFNRAVDDYNARCSSYRYRRGALERVRSDVESRRFSLEQEGRSRAHANP